jgi:non-specific serine/threonine protein kinase
VFADRSLLRTVEDGHASPRFVMLETIREFASERLAASEDERPTRERHAAWVIALATEAAGELFGRNEVAWLDRLESEHDNIRAALTWLLAAGDHQRALAITGAIWWFWETRGHGREALTWMEQALAGAADDAAARIDTLVGGTWIAGLLGDPIRAGRYAEEAVALAKTGDEARLGRTLFMLSYARGGQGDHADAAALAAEALALFERAGDRAWIPYALNRLGIELQGQGDNAGAAARYEEALRRWRDIGQPWGIGTGLLNLGLVMRELGDHARAAALLRECLPIAVSQGDRWGLVELLIGLADIAIDDGEAGLGARLLGAADRLQREAGIVLQPYFSHPQTRAAERARSSLGTAAFEDAWASGRALSLEEAIALAMQPASPAATTPEQGIGPSQDVPPSKESSDDPAPGMR